MREASDVQLEAHLTEAIPGFGNIDPTFRQEFIRAFRLGVQDWAFREGGAPPISGEDRAWYWRWKCRPETLARFREIRQANP
jgi:hypothetical protein